MVRVLLGRGSEVKKITTLQPPRDWTPYDIYIHYGQDLRNLDESTAQTLCRSEEICTNTDLSSEEQIEYSSLEVTELSRHVKCSLCAMLVNVCNIIPLLFISTGSVLTHRRWDSCLAANPAKAKFALCVITLCTMIILIILITCSRHTTFSRLVSLI